MSITWGQSIAIWGCALAIWFVGALLMALDASDSRWRTGLGLAIWSGVCAAAALGGTILTVAYYRG